MANLSLDQLRTLVAIADEGSFSAAGRKLGRVQSAISQTIATLEDMQGVQIFDRSSYRPQLTGIGQSLVDQACLVLASAARFEALATNDNAGIEPELTLAIDPLVPSGLLVEQLRKLNDVYPDLPVNFSTEGLGSSLRKLRSGQAALAICVLLPTVPDDVIAHPIMRTKMIPVAAPDHSLAQLGRAARAADLENHIQLVLSDPVDTATPNYGLASARRWRFVDLARRLDFLRAGFGWCRMPDHLVRDDLVQGRIVSINIEDDTAPVEGLVIYAAHRRGEPLGIAARWFLDELRKAPR